MFEIDYQLPPEYKSLIYLHTKLGDVQVVECVCVIWNAMHKGNTLRVKSADDNTGVIMLTGVCDDPQEAIKIGKWLTTFALVQIRYEKTIFSVEI